MHYIILILLFMSPIMNIKNKRLQTCSYSYIYDSCPTDSCLPNIQMLALGFDITDSTYKSYVLGLTWGSGIFTNQYTGTPYTTPYGVSIITLDESNDITGSVIIHNITESEQFQSDTYVSRSDYITGMSSNTIETYRFISAQYTENSQLGYTLYNTNIYEAVISKDEQVLTDEAYYDMLLLPDEYNQDAYIEYILTYGTHYHISSKFGAKYKNIDTFKECMIYTQSEEYVYTQSQTDGWIHSSEHTTYSGYTQTDSYYQARSYSYTSFEGGDINYHNSDTWNQWIQSVYVDMINPVETSISLKEIYLLFNDTVKQDNMKRAYYEYLQIRKNQQEEFVEQQKRGYQKVSYLAYKRDSMGMIEYITPQYHVNLGPETSTDIFGTKDSCYYLEKQVVGGPNPYILGISQFYCERDNTGMIKASVYFGDWTGMIYESIANQYFVNCGYSSVVEYDYIDNQMVKNYWVRTGYNTYKGARSVYYWNGVNKNQKEYQVSYTDSMTNPFNHTEYSRDGLYTNYISSTVHGSYDNKGDSWLGSYGVCALNCDYITLSIDNNNQVVQSCGC